MCRPAKLYYTTVGALSSGSNTGKKLKKSSRSNRTTRMLLTVVFLFILTNTPQGILSVLSGLIDKFFHNVYTPLGDLLDIMTLLNNGVNFVLYCTMSKQFRETFFKIFLKKSLHGNISTPLSSIPAHMEVY
jgi:hypothetical protein